MKAEAIEQAPERGNGSSGNRLPILNRLNSPNGDPRWHWTVSHSIGRIAEVDWIGTANFSGDTGSHYVLRWSLASVINNYARADTLIEFRKYRRLKFDTQPRSLAYPHFGELRRVNAGLHNANYSQDESQKYYSPVGSEVWFNPIPPPELLSWRAAVYSAPFSSLVEIGCLCLRARMALSGCSESLTRLLW